jgi:hypothetical protein
MTCLTAVFTPFEFAFTTKAQSAGPFFSGMDVVFTAIFGLDILVNLNTKIEIVDRRTGKPTFLVRRRDIFLVYLRGWLIIDVLSVFPFRALGLAQHRAGRILRVLRMLRLIRVVQASMAWENLSKTSTTSHALKDLWQLILYTLLLAHWFSCTMMLATYHYERYGLFQSAGLVMLNAVQAAAETLS